VINNSVDPDTVVAHGATVMAGILSGRNDREITLSEIVPMSLGIAVDHEKDVGWIRRLFKAHEYEKVMETIV